MKVLIVGSGGREHALAWACKRSPLRPEITCAPGNGGTSLLGRNVAISPEDIEELVDFVRDRRFDLTVIGPDAPVARGLADRLAVHGFRAFGASQGAARVESSKVFAKRLMEETGVPTASFRIFTDKGEADAYIREVGAPIVVKASGLAAGKGALVCSTVEEAFAATQLILQDRAFGAAGYEVVVERFVEGREVSMTAIADGTDFLLLPPSRDHKRLRDDDQGPNTGGMGAFAPVDDIKDAQYRRFAEAILPPLLNELDKRGTPFSGAIYPGLMVNGDDFTVLEVNARFGDPESQVLLPLMKDDPLELMAEVAEGGLGKWLARSGRDCYDWRSGCRTGYALTVVAAAPGYPGSYPKGLAITGLPEEEEYMIPFHAGTKKAEQGFVTTGGRVLAITGLGRTLEDAATVAYRGVERGRFEGMHYRRDIGRRTV